MNTNDFLQLIQERETFLKKMLQEKDEIEFIYSIHQRLDELSTINAILEARKEQALEVASQKLNIEYE